jgi:hypothetical protein
LKTCPSQSIEIEGRGISEGKSGGNKRSDKRKEGQVKRVRRRKRGATDAASEKTQKKCARLLSCTPFAFYI